MMRRLIILSLILLTTLTSWAQMEKLPIDPSVRHGQLENGMTYYIRHNELPKERAEFFIAHNVGAVLEEDEENGLAHFLEHMAFNGSTNFPGNSLINYLESIGVKFGQNLNAYTSFDRTVYNISNVPTSKEGAIDSCLLILHDWSGSLLLEEKEIDKERGVIREEMRGYGGASWRISNKIKQQVLPGNQYAKRDIIGSEEVILNFEPETIRGFYKKWYRPSLQAVIVVGDINVDEIENKIKSLFADIPNPENPAERIFYTVEDNEEPLVGIAQDKELPYTSVSIGYKHDPLPKELEGTSVHLLTDYFNSIAALIASERLNELAQKADPPFVGASFYNGSFFGTQTKEAVQGAAAIKDNNIELGFKTILREMERINRHGFTESEYDRVRTSLLTRYENIYNERNNVYSARYAQEYVSHFTSGSYIPGIETEYQLMNQLAPSIPVDMVNKYIQRLMGETNIVITLQGGEQEGVEFPTKETLLQWFNEVKNETIEAFADNVITEPLMTELPQGGKIVKEEKDKRFESTVLTLSNGVKVIIKTTDFKDNQILMHAVSPGGSGHFDQKDRVNNAFYSSLSNVGGLGKFSQIDLRKVLTGKTADVSPIISSEGQGFSGSSNIKDFETMLQLVYLHATAPRTDEEVAQSILSRIKSQLATAEVNPDIAFSDSITKSLYVDQTLKSRILASEVDQVNYPLIMEWRKDRYKNANGLIFTFVGNINPDETKELIAQYLGALPSTGKPDKKIQVNNDYRKGITKNHFTQSMENKKSSVFNAYWGKEKYSLKGLIQMNLLNQILRIVYTEKVREDEGGTYGVSVGGSLSDYKKGRASIQISFQTEPGKEARLNEIVHAELAEIAKNGPRQEDFNKAKEFSLKNYPERIRENGYWTNVISTYYNDGIDRHTDYLKLLNNVTPADVQKMAQSLVKSGNLIEVVVVGVE